ncbi:MAG TPA: penicillin acylase family protein, partial [Candidatus Omnitrophota bacterium]|nr:penicillin acylase family protein [Candidatus Omnitrophota bacterium]
MQDQSLEAADPPRDEVAFTIGEEMSRWAKAVNALILLTVVSASVAFVWLMSSLPRIEGRMPIKGLNMTATVARDHYGVPRITARSVRDAYFAMGWVHSQDRLWQMELQRRVGAGRLAEIVGDKGLPNDRFMRTLGLYRLAEAGFDKLDKPTRDALTAYAEGVNAWTDAHWHRLPVEFVLLGVRPEPWKPADTLVWARLMALQLTGNWRDELLKARLAGKLDARRMGELWPGYPGDAPVTISQGPAKALLDAMPEAAEPRLASNVWAVAGSRTATGKPLLANDPHLGFQAPVLWYLAGIEAPGLSVVGATVPGVPFHLIGHNGRIAWGTTTTHADTVDLFVEKAAGADAYMTPEGPRPFVSRDEVIRVKGGDDQVLKVRSTRHGPVISDLIGRPGEIVAMRATALEPDDLTAQAMMRVNRAVDWKGFQAALRDFAAPVQNFAFA